MLYLTPDRYRTLGTGVDLSGTTDAELRTILTNASQMANRAAHAPINYSFLGGTVTEEEHQWMVGNKSIKRPSGRIWPFFRPVREVSNLRINVTRTQYIDFDDQQIFTQTDLGYTEPVAAPNTTALFTSVPPWLLTSPVAYVDYTYGFSFDVVDEPMTSYSSYLMADNQFWFSEEDVALKKNGAVMDPGDYTVNYTEGTIVPDSMFTDDDEFLVSYSHKLPPDVKAAVQLIATDLTGSVAIAAAGLLGLSGMKVEEVELRQSSKVNFAVTPVNPAAQAYMGPYAAMFTSMR